MVALSEAASVISTHSRQKWRSGVVLGQTGFGPAPTACWDKPGSPGCVIDFHLSVLSGFP